MPPVEPVAADPTAAPGRTAAPGVPVAGPVWTVVVAAGSGTRIGVRKQFVPVGGREVVAWALEAAAAASDGVVLVVPADDVDGRAERHREVRVVAGGATRSASVRAGLAAVPAEAAVVCVHDGARPFASPALFRAVVDAVRAGADGAVPGVAVTDTVKVVDAAGRVTATPDRDRLVAVQTPQAFAAGVLRAAHAAGGEGTDDAALVEAAGGTVVVVAGETVNRKVTRPEDLAWAEAQARREGSSS
jgi:2-C-methyl-D-erythritol 4-phosphate cytidylyltransferase